MILKNGGVNIMQKIAYADKLRQKSSLNIRIYKWFTGMRKRQESALYVMLIAPVLLVLIYSYGPMFGLVMAFQKYRPALGFLNSKWVGFENFRTLFATHGFNHALINTVIIAVSKIIMSLIVPITFSLLLNEMACAWLKRSIQTIIYLPHFISWIIMSGIIIQILSPSTGIVNKALELAEIDDLNNPAAVAKLY
jgi:putative aldouronate transport system permease protein